MFKYNGYLIVTEPDYKNIINEGRSVDSISCQVYDENDTEQEQILGDFNIVRGSSYQESSAEAIERAIMEVVEEDQSALELVRKTNELNRVKELLSNAAEYIGESVGHSEVEEVLKESVGMTDEEYENFYGGTQENIEEGMKML